MNTNGVEIQLGCVDEATPGGITLGVINSCINAVGSIVHLRVRIKVDDRW